MHSTQNIGDYRFIPYFQLHEFESLIFAYPRNLEFEYLNHENAILSLENQLKKHGNNPELINEKRETAPSKRILKAIPKYDKVSIGAVIAGIDGIEPLKKKCKHFDKWLKKLESLSN